MAFFEEIAVTIGLDPKELRKGAREAIRDMRDVKKAAADIGSGLTTMGKGFDQVGAGLASAAKTATVAIATIAGAAATLFTFTAAGAEAADSARKGAQALGLTIEEYGEYQFAAEQSGLAAEEFQRAFVELNEKIAAARRGDANAVALFENLGVQVTDTEGRVTTLGVALKDANGRALTTGHVLRQIARNFALVGDSERKTELAVAAFGTKIGPRLIPLLNSGARGLVELGQQARKLGVVFTEAGGKIGEDFQDATARTGAALTGLRNEIALTFAPSGIALADEMTAAIVRQRPALTRLAVEGFQFARQAALDLFNAFSGNDADVANTWALTLRDNVVALRDTIVGAFQNIILPLLAKVRAAADQLATAINEHFGTNLTGAEILFSAFVFKILGGFNLLLGAVTVVVGALQGLVGVFKILTSPLFLKAITFLFDAFAAGLIALSAPIAAFLGIPAAAVAAFIAAGVIIAVFWDDIIAGLQKVWDFSGKVGAGIVDIFKGAGQAIASFFGFGRNDAAVADPPGFAEGGLVGGKAGRDTNLGRLTRGEFVNTTATVDRLGVPFFRALEAGRTPAAAPETKGDRAVIIPIGDKGYPATMAEDVLESVLRAAKGKARRRVGVKPSWAT